MRNNTAIKILLVVIGVFFLLGVFGIASCTAYVVTHRPHPMMTPAYHNTVMTTSQLESELSGGGWTDGSTADTVSCVGQSVRSNGAGTYVCLVGFTSGTSKSVSVIVDDSGNWVTN